MENANIEINLKRKQLVELDGNDKERMQRKCNEIGKSLHRIIVSLKEMNNVFKRGTTLFYNFESSLSLVSILNDFEKALKSLDN